MSELYLATVSKGGWFCPTRYRSTHQPILLDGKYADVAKEGCDSEELQSLVSDRLGKEPIILMGSREQLIELIDIYTEETFNNAVTATELAQRDTIEYLYELVRNIPNPVVIFKRMLKRSVAKGLTTLCGIPLTESKRDIGFTPLFPDRGQRVTCNQFLRIYRERLQQMAVAGLISEVDPDLSIEELARDFILNFLAEEMALNERSGDFTLPTVIDEVQIEKELDHLLFRAA